VTARPVAWSSLAILLVGFGAVQLLAYREALGARPSADDFIIPVQIRVAEQTSPLRYFIQSPLGDYRPLQWITAWLAGRWTIGDPFLALHLLSFAAYVWYAFVLTLWLVYLEAPLWPAACVVGFVALHPVLAGPIAESDGFGRLVVSGWVWLGTYLAARLSERLEVGVPLVAVCLVVGLGYMEYTVSLLPLATLAVFWLRRSGRLAGAAIMGGTLLLTLVAYSAWRHTVIPSGADASRLSFDPLLWTRNAGLLAVGVLYLGNTAEVHTDPTWPRLTLLGLSSLGLALAIGGGFWLRWRSIGGSASAPTLKPRRPAAFLPSLLLASFAPMVFMGHVSEIYASSILFAAALLLGEAAEGWSQARRRVRIVLLLLLAVGLVWGFSSIRAKVAALRARGERAAQLLASLASYVPPDARDLTVTLVFSPDQAEPQRNYSVFLAGDHFLVQEGTSTRCASEWLFPGRNIRLVHHLARPNDPLPSSPGPILCWSAAEGRFQAASTAACPPG
jgi:hypothetical protein